MWQKEALKLIQRPVPWIRGEFWPDDAEPMSKYDIYRRRIEGERMHWWDEEAIG